MIFLIQEFSLLPAFVHSCSGVHQVGDVIELEARAQIGSFFTSPFEAKLAHSFWGFELQPAEAGIQVALLNQEQNSFSYKDGSWRAGGYSSAAEIRAGLSSWHQPGYIQFSIRLERLPDGSSPKVNLLKFGYRATGNILSYLIEYGLPRLFSQTPVDLVRWTDTENGTLSDINPDRVLSRYAYSLGGLYQINFDYQIPVRAITSELYQLDEAPIVLLRPRGARNHRKVHGIESVRISDSKAQIVQASTVCDQAIEVTVIARTLADLQAIAEHLVGIIEEQNCVYSPAYGITIGVQAGGIESGINEGSEVDEGGLPSSTFTITLLNLPVAERFSQSDILLGVEQVRWLDQLDRSEQ